MIQTIHDLYQQGRATPTDIVEECLSMIEKGLLDCVYLCVCILH
jgi:hypothetical protein